VNDAFAGFSSITFGVPFGRSKENNITFLNEVAYNRDISEIYKVKNISNQLNVSQSVDLNLTFQEKLNLSLNAYVSFDKVDYSLQKELNTQFFSQTYSGDLEYRMLKRLAFYSSFVYVTGDAPTSVNNGYSLTLWNASLSLFLFKNEKGELKLSGNDLLNQNRSIVRTVSENYLSDTRSTTLQRYFMLSFRYSFNGAIAGTKNRSSHR
jgi:hypothetical protein